MKEAGELDQEVGLRVTHCVGGDRLGGGKAAEASRGASVGGAMRNEPFEKQSWKNGSLLVVGHYLPLQNE